MERRVVSNRIGVKKSVSDALQLDDGQDQNVSGAYHDLNQTTGSINLRASIDSAKHLHVRWLSRIVSTCRCFPLSIDTHEVILPVNQSTLSMKFNFIAFDN